MKAHETVFVVDANILIDAHRTYYSFDICPGFWDSLLHNHTTAKIISIDRVKDEITGSDALAHWVRNTAPKSLFCSTDNSATAQEYASVMQWVQSQKQFTEEAKAEFARGADGWVVAFAKAHSHVVVTHEAVRHGVKNRVPIPNICQFFYVKCLNIFQMLKILKTEFHWEHP